MVIGSSLVVAELVIEVVSGSGDGAGGEFDDAGVAVLEDGESMVISGHWLGVGGGIVGGVGGQWW